MISYYCYILKNYNVLYRKLKLNCYDIVDNLTYCRIIFGFNM